MDFSSLILPLTKNICRTCLMESESSKFMNIQDVVEHDSNKIKLIDILVYLNCLENNDEENWPQVVCSTCISTALAAYNFKLNCFKATSRLSRIFMIQSPTNFQRTDIDAIDINVVYQDHEYDTPLFSNNPTLDFDTHLSDKKELTPLPPVTVITSTEQPARKEADKTYPCTLCDKSFTRPYGLECHMVKHNGAKCFLCPTCGKEFHTSGGLSQHSLSHKDLAQFKCGFCNKTYKSRQSLKEHFRVAHSNNRPNIQCVICCKKFTAKRSLMMHMRIIHKGEKYLCLYCSKTYTRASYLRAHSLVHSGQEKPRPFSCDQNGCNRSFHTKHSLQVHIAHTHSKERPHKCDRCFKGFATASGLKTHQESHTEKKLSCDMCGKILANKRVLQKHIKTHDVDANDMILETVVDNVFFDQVY